MSFMISGAVQTEGEQKVAVTNIPTPFGKGTMTPILATGDAQNSSIITKILPTFATEFTASARDHRIKSDPVSRHQVIDIRPDADHDPSRFVSHHKWRNTATGTAVHYMPASVTAGSFATCAIETGGLTSCWRSIVVESRSDRTVR